MAIQIDGGKKVSGSLVIQGSKNAVLPIMAASVLGAGTTVIENCPDIFDVHAMSDVLRSIGASVNYRNHTLTICSSHIKKTAIEEKSVGEIRASILLLGSVLARLGSVSICYPGGCSIGSRPIDFHLRAFRKMGAQVNEEKDRIDCLAKKRLTGTTISLPFPSVGATENIILTSVLAEGETVLLGAAMEPEITELCRFLRKMGAQITGEGTDTLRVCGVKELKSVRWGLCADRIVFLTWAMLTAGCGGEAELFMKETIPCAEKQVLEQLGCMIEREGRRICLSQKHVPRPIRYLKTQPYPGYPTDGQSLIMPVLCKGNGVSTIEEGIFENRFRMIRQLKKMGANIDYVCNHARITGVTKLHGALVQADDLRSGAGLLIGGAMAEGRTTITKEHFINRGYENVTGQLQALGILAEEV